MASTPAVSDQDSLAADVRAIFEELARQLPHDQRAYSGECHPAIDVRENDAAVQVIVDVAGVPPTALRVRFRAGVLLVAGEKAPPADNGHHSFHLVERAFGRFARAVRLAGAFDVTACRATLRDGELTIILPKRTERRGQAHDIAITVPGADIRT